jgi:hypothetical protein
MKSHALKFGLIIFLLTACGSSSSTPIHETEPATLLPTQTSATQTSSAQRVLKYHPLETRTNVREIDDVLKAVSSDNPHELINLFGYLKTPCRTVNALGGPPACREGEAEGTIVEVLPSLGPEGSFLHKDEAGKFPGLNVTGIYAIYKVSDQAYSVGDYPAGDYGIVLGAEENLPSVVLQVKNGRIVRIDYILDSSTLDVFLQRDASRFLLEPLK